MRITLELPEELEAFLERESVRLETPLHDVVLNLLLKAHQDFKEENLKAFEARIQSGSIEPPHRKWGM